MCAQKIILLIMLLVYNTNASCQSLGLGNDFLRLTPAKPAPGQEVQLEYKPIVGLDEKTIEGTLFLNQIGTEEPRAVELKMEKTDGVWYSTFTTPPESVSAMIIFQDSLGNIDNNNENGYWTPLYSDDQPIPGSFATIAYMYCGAWDASSYKIANLRDIARNLYEKDFRLKPSLKRTYYRYYLNSIRYEKDPSRFIDELSEYSRLDNLTEWQLIDISKKYASIKDTTNSKKFESEVFQKYPTGCWAIQVASLELQKLFHQSKTAKERLFQYNEFKSRFSNYSDLCTKRYLEGINVVIFLRRLLLDFLKEDKLSAWKKNTDILPIEAKYFAYNLGSQMLNEKKVYPEVSEELAKEASTWMEENLDSPRLFTDRLYGTDREIRESREDHLAECLDSYGISLMTQEKFQEAVTAFERALLYSKTHTEEILKHYNEATFKKNSQTKNGKILKNQKTEEKVTISLINESLPDLSFSDFNGVVIDLRKHKGKVVILDFWASWCAPCIEGFKKINQVKRTLRNDKDVIFLFVNTQEKEDEKANKMRARDILKRGKYDFSLLFDIDNNSSQSFNFSSLPTKIVVGKSGQIRYRYSGLDKTNELVEVIRLLQAEK
jgi:thiol-disulfide isomerase/thioredoxin